MIKKLPHRHANTYRAKHSRSRTKRIFILLRLSGERKEEIFMNTEVFTKLIDLAGSMGMQVVFMPMRSGAYGLMTSVEVEHTPKEMEKLMHLAEENNISVKFVPFKASDGRLKYVRDEFMIGIRIGMTFNEYIYTLAHELAHCFLHYDKGDTIGSERHKEYEEQADRAAQMLLKALQIV